MIDFVCSMGAPETVRVGPAVPPERLTAELDPGVEGVTLQSTVSLPPECTRCFTPCFTRGPAPKSVTTCWVLGPRYDLNSRAVPESDVPNRQKTPSALCPTT